MKKLSLIAIATTMTAFAGTAMAEEPVINDGRVSNQLMPTSVRAEAGTTGYGGAVTWTANPYVGVSLGYNGGDVSTTDDISVDGTKYDLDMKNNTTYLNAEIRPWGTSESKYAKAVYVAAGAAYIDNDYDLTKRSQDGTIKINGTNYSYNGSVNGQMSFKNTIAPYVGVGFSPKVTDRIGVFGEVGAYYTGNPTVELDKQGTFVNAAGGNAEQDLRAEESKIRNDDKYAWMPVAKLGVSYHF
ncbi:ornithine uptake porin CarO [Acinetobacter sp. ANC 4178]|uniref:ornithine uptake porin CarO n=1 Tax=Acinetobacter sp. ANC 4178 TaxID=2529839 RepID=UPI00103FF0DC|nr:ornithine uptake porin CarO [Acinetobacter sp. ANC 4178]TCB68805.1 hypothetical protein E0H87_02365 [Acinetobacter sp. ANC 4178]